ncbi:hypothetical protein [Empedobacter brevis]|uniref:hypothetical protein n=1 Tax=Empedobacter brevis TaxID=247 RepID=UPI0028D626F1|nr:hypothetical protein [Empedobacter brevis]
MNNKRIPPPPPSPAQPRVINESKIPKKPSSLQQKPLTPSNTIEESEQVLKCLFLIVFYIILIIIIAEICQ